MLYCILHTLVVYAESIDYGLVSRDSEASWLGVAVLWLRSERAYFNETESEVGHVVIEFTVLADYTLLSSILLRRPYTFVLEGAGWL